MKIFKVFLTILFLICIKLSAQSIIQFEKKYLGNVSEGRSIQQTKDGGYIVVGNCNTGGHYFTGGMYVLKIDKMGNTTWEKTYYSGEYCGGNCVRQTKDDGYIAVGYNRPNGWNYHKVYLLKLNASGNIQWGKEYGIDGNEEGLFIQQTKDGGFIILGNYNTGMGGQILLMKINKNGDIAWDQRYQENRADFGISIYETEEGGYIIGSSSSNSFYLLKVRGNATKIWGKAVSKPGMRLTGMQPTKDGGYILVGADMRKNNGSQDIYAVKTDEDGNVIWEKSFGANVVGQFLSPSVQETKDSCYVICATSTLLEDRSRHIALIKIDKNGEKIWEKAFGENGTQSEGISVIQSKDGGLVMTGAIGVNACIVKTDDQ